MRPLKCFPVVTVTIFALCAGALALGQNGVSETRADARQAQRAASYYDSGEYEKAVEAYKRALQLNPGSEETYYRLGMAYGSLGKFKEAAEAYNNAVRLKPDYAAAYHNLGHAYSNLEEHDKAIRAFRRSIQHEPDNVEAYFALGNVYFNSGREGKAIDTFEAAIRRKPDNPYAYYHLGLLFFPLGPDARSVEAFTQAIMRDPRYADAYFHRAYSYLFLGRGESAAGDAATYIALKGWRAEHSLEMAIVSHFGHMQARQEAAARKVLEEALRQGDPSAWPYRAVEYLLQNVSARLLYKSAADESQKAEARAYIGMALSLRGDQEGALEHLEWVKGHSERASIPFSLAVSEMDRIKALSAVSIK
jgi:cytochrome c-type biogenesis protein CcmH/NrfG